MADNVGVSDHYFSPQPSAEVRQHHVDIDVDGRRVRLRSASGVFSATRLDPGTAVLLKKAPLPRSGGTYLDLGCGYGPIAVTLALASGGRVTAVDVNQRALDLVAANAADLEVDITAVAPQDVPGDATFDQIWSNPPIRVGKTALHDLLEQWLPRLKPEGVAWLVVARHKGADSLVPWLAERGFPTEKYASAKGYRILRAVRPGTA